VVVVDDAPDPAVEVDAAAVVVGTLTVVSLLSLLLLSLASLLLCRVVVKDVAAAVVDTLTVSVAFVSVDSLLVLSDGEVDTGATAVETQTQLYVPLLGSGGVPALTVAAVTMSMRASL